MAIFRGLRLCLCSLGLFLAYNAHAELVLANYGPSKPIKVMAIGDSITDDCSTNGAWRLFLQPMLDTNGYSFNFVGRQTSALVGSFTKRKHEGYCGTVIAPPGVFAAYQYSTTNAYLLRIVADALAIATNRPDLVLLVIGANDIGRGRDPYTVATNHMPQLLDLIFSNVPNANIIISKTTSLQSATIAPYGAYATNVPIYNAALQGMVNRRRALGQNVFLADMFSVVDYNTGFLPDHVHPNPVGLKAMAREFFDRIQAITIRSNIFTSTFIRGGDDWRYSDTGLDLSTNWAQTDFDDGSWSNGLARLGYGDPTTATIAGFGPDLTNKFVTTWFRRNFVVPWNAVVTNLNFRLARTDGAAVWLNGQEIFRTNLATGTLTYTNLALRAMTGFTGQIYYPTNIAITSALKGTNLIAVEMHLNSVTNNAMGFDLELLGSGGLLPLPSLSIARAGDTVFLSWPITNADGFGLYSSTNLAAPGTWTASAAFIETNGGQITVTQSLGTIPQYFRLQKQ